MNGLSISHEFGYEFNPSNREHLERENQYWELWPLMPGDIVRARASFPDNDVTKGDTFVELKESEHGSSGPCYDCQSLIDGHRVFFWQGFLRAVERNEQIGKDYNDYYKSITSDEEAVCYLS